MKKYLLFFLCSILILSGCGPVQQQDAPTIPASPPTVAAEAQQRPGDTELYAVSVPATSEVFQADDGTQLYTYTAQHMQLILPNEDAADKIVLDFLNRVDACSLDAQNLLETAEISYDPQEPWYPYFYQILYSPTRIDQGALSLFGSQSSYSGGMHGSVSCVAVNYDITTGDCLTLGSIMHMDADKADFAEKIIEKLREHAEKYGLFEDYEAGVYSRLSGDESLYEDFYFTQTGLCFFFSPYEIAPYASGIISVEIPYSELTGLIYDGYFPAEREQINGVMHVGSFMQTDMEQFNDMAEVTLVTGEEILVAYPEGTVEDIRIVAAANGINRPDYTVFAALRMSDQNAVVLSLAQSDIEMMSLTYWTGSKQESFPMG